MQWAWRKVTPASTTTPSTSPNEAETPNAADELTEHVESTARRGGLTPVTQIAGPRLVHRGTAAIPTLKKHSTAPLKQTTSAPSLVPHPRRRAPVASIFPAATRQPSGQLRDRPSLIRSGSIYDHVKLEYLETLRALFRVCDLNEDGKVSPSELAVMLELIGLPASEVAQFIARRFPTTDTVEFRATTIARIGLTFDQVLKECRNYIVACAAVAEPPSSTFLVRCKPLKLGFAKCDSDRTGVLTKKELEIALQKLEYFLIDSELDELVDILDRNNDGIVEWSDFVYAAWTNALATMASTADDAISIDVFAELPLLLRPVMPSGASSRDLVRSVPAQKTVSSPRLSQIDLRVSSIPNAASASDKRKVAPVTKSRIERMGVDFLTRISMKRVAHVKRSSTGPVSKLPQQAHHQQRRLSRQSTRSGRSSFSYPLQASARLRGPRRTGFSSNVRRRIQQIEAIAVAVASLAGILSGLVSIWFEGMLPDTFEDEHGSFIYYLCVVLINIAVSLFEVNGMYLTAVICAFRLTVCTNLTLYPQDAEREFLTRAIARAALQVGHRKDRIFGIDPMRGSPRIVLLLSYVMYKSKRYMLKFLLKLFIKRVLWRAAAKSVLSLLVLPINAFMNAWTLRNVMLNCRVSIIGPPCVLDILEVFFLDDDCFTPYQRVDYLRVMGCSLVCKRSVHPNLEIMLDHMRHRWIKPDRWPVSDGCICLENTDDDCCPLHPLDDTTRFLGSLELYASHESTKLADGLSTNDHLHNILFLLIVALIIDGNLDWVERKLYMRVCTAARMQKRWGEILRLKDDFVAGKGIQGASVRALVVKDVAVVDSADPSRATGANARLSAREFLRYLWSRISKLMSW